MRRGKRSGLTVAEALVSMTMILLVAGVISTLVARSSHLLRFGDAQSRRLEVLSFTFHTLRAEVEGCLELVSPNSTGSSSILELRQVDPLYKFPEPLYPSPAGWNWGEIDLLQVRYLLEDGTLHREAGPGRRAMADGLDSFSANLTGEGNVKVQVAVSQEGGTRTFSMIALRH